jgi:hypothetical protein
MFACGWSDITPGDLLKSTDGGQSWAQLTNYLHTAMTEIALHPNSADTLFVTGNILVTKSVDGGNTWGLSANGLPNDLGVYCIDIDPFQPQTLFCSNDNGIYKTQNGADSWNLIYNESCKHFSFNPVYDGIVAAITFDPDKILLSFDLGEMWEDFTDDFSGDNLMDIEFSEDGLGIYIESLSGVYYREIELTYIENPNTKKVKFHFYPNPAKGTINFESGNDSKEIRIYNQTGQLVLKTKTINNKVDISPLPKGMYIIEAIFEKEAVRAKLIVE